MSEDIILDITHLAKSYGEVKVLQDISLQVRSGEVHALMGENGAGKSTLMKILIGMVKADAGSVLLGGEDILGKSILDIQRLGVAMIHQELLLIPELSVAENIYLGREKQLLNSLWTSDQKLNQHAKALLERLELDIDPTAKVRSLSVAERQMIEIAKAVSNEARVIIMDEPTSAISDKEVSSLFSIIAGLKKKGVAIIYISHKMDEIFRIADTVSVLRDGRLIGTHPSKNINLDSLIAMMVGREITQLFPEEEAELGEVVLEVKAMDVSGGAKNINFKLRSGEILGFAGLMGAGRTEIARAIYGMDRVTAGELIIKGKQVDIKSVRQAIREGIGYVGEDRKATGFIPELSVKANISLSSIRKHRKGIVVDTASEEMAVNNAVSQLKVKSDGIQQKVKNLSGGNQQKVVIAKVLQTDPDIIILDEPTRGVDIGAKFEIYKLIHELKKNGKAIILISSELPEILGLADNILVLSQGRQTALLPGKGATEEQIMSYAVR